MSEPLFSPSWYRVARLRPSLRTHAHIHRHDYRGEVWYVLQDRLSGRHHRFTPAAYQLIGLMDGRQTVQEIWERAAEQFDDDAPTQTEMIRLLSQLHAADVLQCNVPPDSLELLRRYQRQQRAKWKQRLWSPLALRFPLFDPERVLQRLLPWIRPVFSRFGFLIWLIVVASAVVLVGVHWSELSENMIDRVLAPQNLLLLWLIFPIVKIFHEFGHGLATKAWGGEVHEMGIMLLVLMPVPYVDASSAAAFKEQHRRMIVGAAGILVELFLAALALFVWLNAEYGLVHAIAYNVMLIGGVSTLFFNGNPLLRFDGYYVLSDALQIPNLGRRSNQYIGYLFQRYLFGEREAQSPATTTSEQKWFLGYGIASFAYRMFIVFAIIFFIAGEFFIVGVILAIWAATTMLVVPVFKIIRFLFNSPRLQRKRARAIVVSGALFGGTLTMLFFIPVPLWTLAEGVIWLPEQSIVRAGTDCFVHDYIARPEDQVGLGVSLIRCGDPLLAARAKVLEGRLEELKTLYAAQWRDDRVAANVTEEEIKAVQADLETTRERLDELIIRSPASGHFVVPQAADLPGKFVHKGEVLGYVLATTSATARVAVPQADVGLVRRQTQGLEVRVANRLSDILPAQIKREVPGGTHQLPTAALGSAGGGRIPVDPTDAQGTKTFQRVFEYEIALPAEASVVPVGTRVYVRFDHGTEPLMKQWYRKVRQVFLGRFGV